MAKTEERLLERIDELLNIPDQLWLLGAGISKEAGIPLMNPLTDRIESLLVNDHSEMYENTREALSENANVEDILSHLGDLIALAQRSRNKTSTLGENEYTEDQLIEFHSEIQSNIRDILRFGYKPAFEDEDEISGTPDNPIVDVKNHLNFIRALFNERRAGFNRRPPVKFFTTNYDTLIEDALALNKLNYIDGFSGGAMAYWNPGIYDQTFPLQLDAELYKLHGSIDWFVNEEEIVVRRREGVKYPDEERSRLLIYPQATKYMLSRKDPFAGLFSNFRESLYTDKSTILVICGYSFRDEHINEEIHQTMSISENTLTILAFAKQDENSLDSESRGLPDQLHKWLSSDQIKWKDRLVVASDYGLFLGDMDNKLIPREDQSFDWWTFKGLTKLLKNGPKEIL